jgi:hypothetical protein
MTAVFTQNAFAQLPPNPVNYTGDVLQVVNALAQINGNLANWTLRIANAMNLLMPSGGPVPVTQGGTGRATLTIHSVLLGEGVAPVNFAVPGTAGIALVSAGAAADPSFSTVLVVGGGTGAVTFTAHGVLIGEGTGPVVATAAGGSGIPLIGQGAADPIFGTAIVAGGGTGITSGVSGGIPYFSSTTTIASSGLLPANAIVTGGGAGSAPGFMLGTSGGIPYFSATNVGATTALLAANGFVLGGGAGTAPFTDTKWTIEQTNHTQVGDYHSTGSSGTPYRTSGGVYLQGADSVTPAIQFDTYAARGEVSGRRADGTNNAKSALGIGVNILALTALGFGSTGYGSASRANVFLQTAEAWGDTAQGCAIVLQATRKTTTTTATVGIFTAAQDGGCQFTGTSAGDSAGAGVVGEYASAIVLQASEVACNAAANIVTLNLSAGDWDVWGEFWVDTVTGGATVSGNTRCCITQTGATIATTPADGTASAGAFYGALASSNVAAKLPVGPTRVSLTTATNVFLVGAVGVSAGTANGYGILRARRFR